MQLRCLDEGGRPLKHASTSGFVRMEGDVPFLYTRWHVVAGYDRLVPEPTEASGVS
ncbi:MAG: hypothetical protein ACYDAE_01445 [Steroidobacteraceae bacterium]